MDSEDFSQTFSNNMLASCQVCKLRTRFAHFQETATLMSCLDFFCLAPTSTLTAPSPHSRRQFSALMTHYYFCFICSIYFFGTCLTHATHSFRINGSHTHAGTPSYFSQCVQFAAFFPAPFSCHNGISGQMDWTVSPPTRLLKLIRGI